jgi:hypothetical protein
LIGQNGQRVTTNTQGQYAFTGLSDGYFALAPTMNGYVFSPAMGSVSTPSQGQQQNFTALTAASELVVNGGFETVYSTSSDPWELPATEFTASYTTEGFHSGTRSVVTGITKAGQNRYSYSSVRQKIAIPSGATSATLTVWVYPYSTEAGATNLPEKPASPLFGDAALTSDAQYALVLDANDNLLETLMWVRSNAQQWTLHTFNLKKYAGKTVQIQFGTYNDGWDGITALYVDDVSVLVDTTGGGTTPTPTPTVTPPAPGTCTNPIGNPGFEVSGSWNIPVTEYPAGVSSDLANSGTRSMRTGIVKAGQNRFSYSDAWQTVDIPSNATNPSISLYIYRSTAEAVAQTALQKAAESMPSNIADFGKAPLSSDMSYVMVIDEGGNIHYLYQNLVNHPSWDYKQYSLAAYKGQTIRIQFGTFNDGLDGISSMYVDDIIVDNCAGATPTPGPTATPLPTPVPGVCTEKFGNTSFEANSDWIIPVTAFSAGYSTDRPHTGLRSMRTGIIAGSHNRYSYSDFRQAVTIPSTLTSAKATMWLYPTTGESTAAFAPERPTGDLASAAASAGDVQYVLVLDAYGNWIDTLVWQRTNTQTWTSYTFDLTAYKGMTIQLHFGTYNDGLNGVTSMYVDDVSFQVCP